MLTARERDVLRHMAEGRSNAGIGLALALSGRTVEAHVASVFLKLGLAVQRGRQPAGPRRADLAARDHPEDLTHNSAPFDPAFLAGNPRRLPG